MAVPDPEGLLARSFLSPEEAIAVEAISARRVVGTASVGRALSAAFMVYRWIMQRRMEKIDAPTPLLMEQALLLGLEDAFASFQSSWVKMSSPLMYAGYLAGVKQSGVTLPTEVLEQMANGYSQSLGTYIHTVSSDAMLSGFRALVNRKVDHRRALRQTASAFGVGPRAMNTLVNVWTAEEEKAYTNVKRIGSVKEKRASLIASKGIKDRARTIGAHEAWNAREQAKEAAWLWAMGEGIITGSATKVWQTADDERVCPSCGPLDGVKIKVTEKFETDLGKTLTPPLHVNCRCEVKLRASMRRILLGQLRKQPVKKAYEGHPWARHQKRDEEGQWVKGPSSQDAVPQPALAPQPVDDPEQPEPPPPPPPPQQPDRLSFGRPSGRLSFGPSSLPAGRLSFPSAQPEQPPPVERLSFPSTPPVERLAFPPQPAERLSFPPHKTPFSHATYTPSQATPQPVAPRPQERQHAQEDLRAAKPGIIAFDRGHELYAVMPADMEPNAAEVTVSDLDAGPDINQLKVRLEDALAEKYEESIQNEFATNDTKLVYSQGGRKHYADEQAVRELIEWTRGKQLALEHDEDLRDWTARDATISTTTNYDRKDHQLAAEELYDKVKVDGLPIPDLLESLMPAVVKIPRVDSNPGFSRESMNRTGPTADPDWNVSGPHRNFGLTDPVTDPDTDAQIGSDTYLIDPFDWVDDDEPE